MVNGEHCTWKQNYLLPLHAIAHECGLDSTHIQIIKRCEYRERIHEVWGPAKNTSVTLLFYRKKYENDVEPKFERISLNPSYCLPLLAKISFLLYCFGQEQCPTLFISIRSNDRILFLKYFYLFISVFFFLLCWTLSVQCKTSIITCVVVNYLCYLGIYSHCLLESFLFPDGMTS